MVSATCTKLRLVCIGMRVARDLLHEVTNTFGRCKNILVGARAKRCLSTRMRTLVFVLLLAACGGSDNNGGGGDAGNKPADARVFLDAPPNVPAMITISGTALDNGANSSTPLAGATVSLLKVSDDSMLGTMTTGADGKYSFSVTTNGQVVDAYVKATKSGYAPAAAFPASPFEKDSPGTDSNLITSANFTGLQFISGQQPGKGFVVVGILDTSDMPVGGVKISSTPSGTYKYSDSNGNPTLNDSSADDGRGFFTNLTPGMVTISATKSGAVFKSHTVKAPADVFTSTVITE